jgi:class 3 adenylate cyclase/tetratricopeptide (TPR) repeat protein
MPPSEERKLVTVLFADLAGSTELAVQQDPERLRALLSAFFEEMTQQIRAFGGVVEKYAGDAIMAVFGVPQVHEDDAERAVRAAVAMRESLSQLNPMFEQEYGARLDLRVGIATGEAVAVTDPTREFMVTGEVTNLAARLQSAALGVVVSAETYRLVGALVDSESLGPVSLKGFPVPVTAHLVTGLRPGPAPRGIEGLSSPVVGRDREIGALRRCAEDLARGRGQIVSITGEAGIGKSRLKNDLRDNPPQNVRWLEGRCQAFTQTASYAPLVQVLRALVQLSGAEASQVARTKLRVTLRSLVGDQYEQVHPAVAHLLGMEREPGQSPPAAMDPRALKSQLVLGLRAIVEALAARGPLILTVEDLHWADAATIEIMTVLSELTDLLPLMLLVTSRPDSEGGGWDFRFQAQRHYSHRLTELTLVPLPVDESERLVENLLHVAELPEAIRGRILEQSEGNPFFVEEIIRSLIEEGMLRRERDRWVAAGDMSRLVMPATLRGLIAARIDRLPELAKATLQRASVVGRFVNHRALRALHDDASALDRSIAALLRAELVREWAHVPEREYLFKHALTQEAAYASILLEQRRALHQRLAVFLEQEPTLAADRAALLAHHWWRAEDWEKALTYSLEAAERAMKLYARPEAIAHYWRVLELLNRLPATVERKRLLIDALLRLMGLPGWRRNDRELTAGREHLERALKAATELDSESLLARVEAKKGWDGQDEACLQRAVDRAETSGDDSVRAFVALHYGGYLGQVARYEASLTYIGQGIELLGAMGQLQDQAYEMASGGRCYSARAGRLSEALDYAARARQLADRLEDPRLRAWRAMEAEPYMYKGLWDDVVRVAEEDLPHCWEIREWDAVFFVSGWAAIAYVKLGRHAHARKLLERALPECEALGAPHVWGLVWLQMGLAQLSVALVDGPAGLTAARRAADIAEQSHFRLEQGAALRVLGQACEVSGDRAEADTRFRQSLDVLEAIQSRPEVGQTLLAYGRFLARENEAAGRALVARALSLFEEMDATGWIEEARRAQTETLASDK